MPLLEAFLALALTMLSLAMIATLVVEAIHRILKMRSKKLKQMLGEFFDAELRDKVETELGKSGAQLDEYKNRFITKLTSNPLMLRENNHGIVGPITSNLKPLVELSTVDFFKRLANTEIGKKVKDKAEVEVNEFVDNLALTYEGFAAAATDLFKRRASVYSQVVGVLIAVVLNVNALFILDGYMQNPQLTADVIAKADLITQQYEKVKKQKTAVVESALANDDKAGDEKAKPSTENGESENYIEFNQNLEDIRTNLDQLKEMGLDVGYRWNRAPGSLFLKVFRPYIHPVFLNETAPANVEKANLRDWLELGFYVLGIVGTGLLIGLGAPFWYNLVMKITSILEVVRGKAPSAVEQVAATEGVSQTALVAIADPMQAHRVSFKMTGGMGKQAKKEAVMVSSAKLAATTDLHVKVASEALERAQQLAKTNPDNNTIRESVVNAEKAFAIVQTAQKQVYNDVSTTLEPEDISPSDQPRK